MKTNLAVSKVLIFLSLAVSSCRSSESLEQYAKVLENERHEKDDFMMAASDSPFKNAEKFHGLKYYPPDATYKIKADFTPIEDPNVVELATSDNKQNEYLEFGYAEFQLGAQHVRLLILEVTDPGAAHGTLFLAFADSTSARTTYGAGRYLEIKKIPGMTSVVLDFNRAYNPYCAYNDGFSCPLPPKENVMNVAIKAGEKAYH